MTPFTRLAVLALVACAHAQYQEERAPRYQEERAPRYIASEPKAQASTPVPILKQINSEKFSTFEPPASPAFLRHLELLGLADPNSKKRRRRNWGSTFMTPASPVFMRHLQLMGLADLHSEKSGRRHNEDGSYTYGYEAADGSFKIETKSPAGEVKGKYGYKDDTGKVRVIEYGANKYGFQPAGEGITVAPPTLVDETTRQEGSTNGKWQAGRNNNRPAPSQAVDYDYTDEPTPPRPAPQYRPQSQNRAPAPKQLNRAPVPQHLQNRAPPPPLPQPLFMQYRAPTPTQKPQPPQQYRQQDTPVPPRPAFFAGAAPTRTEDNFFPSAPVPQRRNLQPKQEYNPAPQYEDFTAGPPQYQDFNADFRPHQANKPNFVAPQPKNSKPYSMLDQLLLEYGLPEHGAPALHDITFGTY